MLFLYNTARVTLYHGTDPKFRRRKAKAWSNRAGSGVTVKKVAATTLSIAARCHLSSSAGSVPHSSQKTRNCIHPKVFGLSCHDSRKIRRPHESVRWHQPITVDWRRHRMFGCPICLDNCLPILRIYAARFDSHDMHLCWCDNRETQINKCSGSRMHKPYEKKISEQMCQWKHKWTPMWRNARYQWNGRSQTRRRVQGAKEMPTLWIFVGRKLVGPLENQRRPGLLRNPLTWPPMPMCRHNFHDKSRWAWVICWEWPI